mmetsp:Transcript_138153/g.240182  ORF Transcript_138153/g.240182 Transcript_138153/m.240182 type:complete len:225 (+) Transcript_138153:1430-2104(+)
MGWTKTTSRRKPGRRHRRRSSPAASANSNALRRRLSGHVKRQSAQSSGGRWPPLRTRQSLARRALGRIGGRHGRGPTRPAQHARAFPSLVPPMSLTTLRRTLATVVGVKGYGNPARRLVRRGPNGCSGRKHVTESVKRSRRSEIRGTANGWTRNGWTAQTRRWSAPPRWPAIPRRRQHRRQSVSCWVRLLMWQWTRQWTRPWTWRWSATSATRSESGQMSRRHS